MALVSCPDCGAQVSDTAVVCVQCGFPLRRDVLAASRGAGGGGGGGRSSSTTAAIIIGLAGAGLVVVVIIGILAALAIPRFTMAAQRAREKEGEGLLKQAYTLENAYYANHGAYAPTMEELKTVGWVDPAALHYEVEIRLGPAPREICLEARPKRGADVQPLSMDSAGVMYHDEGCTGETLADARAPSYPEEATENVPGDGGDAGARTLLGEVYVGMAEYRAENGRDATELGQVLRHVHFTRASNENTLSVSEVGGRACISAVRKSADVAGRNAFSVDGDGRLYRGEACSGPVLEQFPATASGDSAGTTGGEKPS